MSDYTDIDINKWEGDWPNGHDLVVHEKGADPDNGYVLYGWDEIGLFDCDFKNPTYSFVKC